MPVRPQQREEAPALGELGDEGGRVRRARHAEKEHDVGVAQPRDGLDLVRVLRGRAVGARGGRIMHIYKTLDAVKH